MYPNTNQLKTI